MIFGVACNSVQKESPRAIIHESAKTKKLDEYFSALLSLQKFNGAVLVQKEGKVILYKAYNMVEDETSSLFVQSNSQFDVHSISKLMAKACIVNLEQNGLINRTDKLAKFIPDFPNGDKITIEHLLQNASGLPRNLSDEHEDLIKKSPAEFVDLIRNEKLLFTPGSETLYSNLGYQLVYYIISKITKKSFVQYLNDEFFEPNAMHDSGAHFYFNKSNLTRAVKNHVEDDDKIVQVPNYLGTSKNQSRVYSTLEDLLKFGNAVKSEPYRSALINKSGVLGWSGGGEGILTHMGAYLETGYELIFFSNYDEISFGRILEDVESIMTNKPYLVPKEINRKATEIDPELIKQYVGKFDMAEFNHHEFEIRLENSNAAFYQNGEAGGILSAENDTTFFGDPTDEDYFIFRKDGQGDYNMIFMHKGIPIIGKRK